MLRYIASSVVLCIMLTLPGIATAQSTRAETEKRLRALQDQMTLDVIRISETEELERATLSTLGELDKEIKLREELISTNQSLLRQIERSRDSLASSMKELQTELSSHREQYQRRAVHAYKYGRLHDVALILAAESINQMLIRIRYLNQFAEQRRSRLTQILSATSEIESKRQEMDDSVAEAEELIKQATAQQSDLRDLRTTRSKVVAELKNQKESLQAELKSKQDEADKLESLIRQIISNESNRRAAAPAQNPVDAAANAELSSSFLANKGGLSWPAQGAIIEPYGTTINAVYGTATHNPGIVISTTSSAEVLSIADGEVIEIYQMPEWGRIVTVSHGEFTSLYGNLSVIYLTSGTTVRAGQLIGRSGTNAEPKGNALFFGLFRGSEELDPEEWLR